MYKVIVVGTDGSDRAARAIEAAFSLAQLMGATVHIVHVMRLVAMASAGYGDPSAIATANSDARDNGDLICGRVLADAERQGVAAHVHNVDGDPADMLVKVAESVHADLVVIGNRGMTGVKRLVLGSVPNKVSHHCPCSVLIVDTDPA
jgi:nucleotide-binding universal stress UspA family protein